MLNINDIIQQARKQKASDIHIVNGLPIKCRIDGQIRNLSDERVAAAECEALAEEIAGQRYEQMRMLGELDMAMTASCGTRVRINIFRARGGVSFAIRLLSDDIPDLEALELPGVAEKLPAYQSGLVLITGETGSGKSTTLASVLNRINHTACKHIITLEDPIEYVYTPDLCVINQREVGKDTASFSEGLRASLREDPDVILIGEMRDKDTIETAITAAETGHLVFGTLHTGSASDAIDRMVQVFPEGMQNQIRLQLSMTLMAVISQQLVNKKTGGRVLAIEVMFVTDGIRNMIRGGNTPQIANAIATSAAIGGQTMDQSLVSLVRSRQIDKAVAVEYSHDQAYVKKNA